MGTVTQKWRKLIDSKADICAAINEKGVPVDASVKFSAYGDAIRAIPAGGGVVLSPTTLSMATGGQGFTLKMASEKPFTLTSDVDGVLFAGSASKSYGAGFFDVTVLVPANTGTAVRQIVITATIDGTANKTTSVVTQEVDAGNYSLISDILFVSGDLRALNNGEVTIEDAAGKTTFTVTGDVSPMTLRSVSWQYKSGVQRETDGKIRIYDNASITVSNLPYGTVGGATSGTPGWAVMFGSLGVSVQNAAGKYMLADYSQGERFRSVMLITSKGYVFKRSQLWESYPSSLGVDEIIGSGNIGLDFPWITSWDDIPVYLPMPWRNPIVYAGTDPSYFPVNGVGGIMPAACIPGTVFNPALQVCDHPENVDIPPSGFSD